MSFTYKTRAKLLELIADNLAQKDKLANAEQVCDTSHEFYTSVASYREDWVVCVTCSRAWWRNRYLILALDVKRNHYEQLLMRPCYW